MKLRPLDDGVVIKQLEAKEKTTGGIILPDAAQEKPQQGRILSVGDGRLLADEDAAAHGGLGPCSRRRPRGGGRGRGAQRDKDLAEPARSIPKGTFLAIALC